MITGVGLFRLWRWARYSMIAFGAFMAVTSALTVAFGVAAPMSAAPDMPRGLQIALVVFYLLLAAVGAGLAYFFTRPAIVEQFGGTSGRTHTRPVSVTIIAWLMLISGAMMVPSVLLLSLPAVVVGALVVGAGARLYYAAYMTAYLVIGVGLLRRTRAFLAPAIGLQVFALLNALASLRPGVWSRYLEAVAAAVPSMTLPAASGTHWWTSGAGVVTAGVMVFFLVKAREQSV